MSGPERERPAFSGPRRPRWRTLRLRDVVFLSLPAWVFLAQLFGGSWIDFREARLFDDWWSRQRHLASLASERLERLLALPEAMRLRLQIDPERPDADAVRLHVDRDVWTRWQQEPLSLWDEWVDAEVEVGGAFERVRLRKRGDTSVHWLGPKKSFTLKSRRGTLFRGDRRVIFSAKTPLEQVAANSLAPAYGLLGPESTLLPVYVNGRFYGLFRAIEVPDEGFLRHAHRLPGNLWRGDTAERGEYYKGQPRSLFENLVLWDRAARNDRPTAPKVSAIEEFLLHLNGSTLADHEALLGQVDRSELARLLALQLVAGDPYHNTSVHNQLWYEDPSTALLHPIVWDVRVRDLEEPAAFPLNDAWVSLLRDPRIFDDALREVGTRQAAGDALGDVPARLHDLATRYAREIRWERLREGAISEVGDADAILARLQANLAVLDRWRADARADWRASPGGVVDVVVSGTAAVELRGLALAGSAESLLLDADGDGRPSPGDRRVALRPGADGLLVPAEPLRLLPAVDSATTPPSPAPLGYRFFVAGASVRDLALANGLTGAPVAAGSLAEGAPLPAPDSFHPWSFRAPAPREIRLAGDVHLSHDLVVPPGGRLEIAPGSVLRLDPDVSILSHGPVQARGTAAAPIRVERAQPPAPWGSFVLQGPATAGSRFEHVSFDGGGGTVLEGIEYTGMVDVHWTQDVRFEDCSFSHNLRSDDGVHVAHGRVDFIDDHFFDANSDALDLDYGAGEIRGNLFERSGNDAIDLMTSAPLIFGNRLLGSDDKGISIGEGSSPLVVGNFVKDCAIGFEVKDGSEPWLVANRLVDNGVAVRQRAKNWRYGEGGFAKWLGPPPVGAKGIESDAHSRLARREDGALDALAVATPLAELVFPPQLAVGPDPWHADEWLRRLERRSGDLVLVFSGRPGRATRALDWRVPAGASLLVEYASRGARDLAMELDAATGPERFALPPSPEDGTAALLAIPLPEGPLDAIALSGRAADPRGRGRLLLRRIRLVVPDAARAAALEASRAAWPETRP